MVDGAKSNVHVTGSVLVKGSCGFEPVVRFLESGAGECIMRGGWWHTLRERYEAKDSVHACVV